MRSHLFRASVPENQRVNGAGRRIVPWFIALAGCSDESRDFQTTERPGPADSAATSAAPIYTSASATSLGVTSSSGGQVTPAVGLSEPAGASVGAPDAASTVNVSASTGVGATCGNAVVEPGEECDDGTLNDDARPGACRTQCFSAACGDGVIDAEEECDGSRDCAFDCRRVLCGNGTVEEGEECDPPREGACTDACRRIRCGNGIIDDGETCEPPNTAACNSTCQGGVCGDGEVDSGEECDPPVEGSCDVDCRLIVCGDGVLSTGEGCEPPGTSTCNAECRAAGCGNGTRDSAEECEPPGTSSCDALCRIIACGNGRVDATEECDPPQNGRCDAQCRSIVCGNSRLDEGENCDPPAAGQCNDSCQSITCGDGRVDPGEQCEPEGDDDSACSDRCQVTNAGSARVLYTFDSNIDPWQVYSTSPESLESGTRLSYDSQNGDVSPGVLRVQAPFTGGNQKVEFQVSFGQGIDLRGRVLRARVRLGSGLSSDAAHPGGIKFFAKAGASFGYASGAWTYLDGGGWADVTLVGDAPVLVPDEFEPADVRQIGFELRTFTETTQVSEAVVYVDSVTY